MASLPPDPQSSKGGLSPTEALRLIRAILADRSMTLAERIATAAIVLSADRRTGLAWASYPGIHREFGVCRDAIAAALRTRPPKKTKGPWRRGKAIGKHVRPVRYGKSGTIQWAVVRPADRCREAEEPASGEAAVGKPPSSSLISPSQQSAEQTQTDPSTLAPDADPKKRGDGGAVAKCLAEQTGATDEEAEPYLPDYLPDVEYMRDTAAAAGHEAIVHPPIEAAVKERRRRNERPLDVVPAVAVGARHAVADQLRELLTAKSIGDPIRSQLVEAWAAWPDGPECVQALIREHGGGSVGLLITKLREAAEAKAAKARVDAGEREAAQAAEVARQQRQEAAQAQRERDAEEKANNQQLLDAATDDELEAYRQLALPGVKGFVRNRLAALPKPELRNNVFARSFILPYLRKQRRTDCPPLDSDEACGPAPPGRSNESSKGAK